MGNLTRIGFVFGAAALVLTAGCEGCNPPTPEPVVQCSDVTISFTAPTATTVDAPFDVSIEAKASDGTAFDFEGAKLTVDNGTPIELAVSGSTATFSAVTAAGGAHTLTVTITKGACGPDAEEPSNKIAAVTKTVTVSTPCTAKVTGVTFPQDANGDGKLNSTELPAGTDMQVQVAASCATGVEVRVKNTTTSETVGALTDISSGAATVSVPVTSDGLLNLFAELVKSGTVVNNTTNVEALAGIEIKRALPACSNTTVALQGPLTDADSATGHQLRATGEVGANSTGVFRITGTGTSGTLPEGLASADFAVQAAGDVTYSVDLVCSDAVGNETVATQVVRVDYVAPNVQITTPAIPSDGGSVINTVSPMLVEATADADTATMCAYRIQGQTRTEVQCSTVTAGAISASIPFSTDGLFDVELVLTDAAGNSSTTRFSATVTLAGCGLAFTRPATCPALITSAQVSSSVYSFQTQSKTTCVGQPVALTVSEVLTDGGITAATQVGTTSVGANGAAGISALVATGSYKYNASVVNVGVDAGVSAVSCDVTVDLDGPVVTSPVVPGGQTVATIGVSQDTSATAGAQRVLQFNARVPVGGRVDVCTTQQYDPVTALERQTTTECSASDVGGPWYLLQSGVTSPTAGFTFPEGTYSIKVVVVSGATTLASPAVPLFVDVTRPCVRAASRRLPQDANSDGKLNLAELASAAPKLEFDLDPSCGDSDFTTLATTNPILVHEVVGGAAQAASFNLAADATLAAGKFTVNLTQGVATEKDYTFFVEVTDKAGNKNLLAASNDPASYVVRIDKAAPTCDITSPAAGQTLFGIAQVPGGNFGVTVATAADVGAGGVALTFGAQDPSALTPDTNTHIASTSYAVSGENTYNITATCTDGAGNATPATARNGVAIDLVAPTCTLTAPTKDGTFTQNDLTTTVAVSGAEGRTVSCTANGTGLAPAMQVTSGVASTSYNYANGTTTLVCRVTDTAGNECVAPSSGSWSFLVNSASCALNLTSTVKNGNGDWHNRSNTTGIVGADGTATITANSSDCAPGYTVTLKQAGAGVPLATTTTDISGNVTFSNIAISEGQTWEVEIDNGTGIKTPRQFRVALTQPTITAVGVKAVGAPATTPIAAGGNLYIVAPNENENVRTEQVGYFASADTAQGTFYFELTGVSGARKFALDANLEVLLNSGAVANGSATLTSDPQTVTFSAMTLAQNASGPFAIRITDAAGNQTTVFSTTIAVDVIAPAAPAVSQSLTNQRAATVTLQWSPTYDDGSTVGSGANAGYAVRWTTSTVVGLTPVLDAVGFRAANGESNSAWSATDISRGVTVPPLNTYYIFVRALDEVGNYSSVVAPSALANYWGGSSSAGTITLSGTGATVFGQTIVSAPLNGDSVSDLVVAAPTASSSSTANAVYVYFGSAALASQASCTLPACQTIAPYDGAAGYFGLDLSVAGNVGDSAANEGKPDLLIAQPSWTGSPAGGRAILYFGGTGSTIDTAATNRVEFRPAAAGYSYASAARIIKSIDGDALDEVLITAHGYNTNQGRVFIFKGRSIADWQALVTSSGGVYVPSTAADWILDGPTPTASGTGGNQFARLRYGIQSLGDLNGDGRPEFSIPISKEADGAGAQLQKVYIYSGATVAASTAAVPLTVASALKIITAPLVRGTGTGTDGFSRSVVGGLDVSGSTGLDLLVAYPLQSRVHLYTSPLTVALDSPSDETITGNNNFGYITAAGDLTGDSRPDILAGTAFTSTTSGQAWVVYQRSGASSFDTAPNQFWGSKLEITGVTTKLGRMVYIGDVTGEGQQDIIVGDEGAATPSVHIWK